MTLEQSPGRILLNMKRPRIYSDLNGPWQPSHMLLSHVGTLCDLNTLKIVLREGLLVTVYSDSDQNQDIEMDGVVVFGPLPDSGEAECWHVRTDAESLRFVDVKRDEELLLPCFGCGANICEHLNTGRCPVCGLDVEHARRR